MHKESVIISYNTLLHVSTLLGHLQGERFCYRYTKVGWQCAVDTVNSTLSLNYKVQP
jgi:hypothetical protein